MAVVEAGLGYRVEDLDWLRAELGLAHLELDPWGSLIVSPASDEHGEAIAVLHGQMLRQLDLPLRCVRSSEFPWRVPGGSGYTNVPDLVVLAPGWRRVGDWHLDPPPLLVAEVASPSTRGVDRSRKLSDYRLGGAGCYLLVDLPGEAGEVAAFTVYDFAANSPRAASGRVEVVVGGHGMVFDLTDHP